jgi:hypothetical protein
MDMSGVDVLLQHSRAQLWKGKLLGCEGKLESTVKTWIIVEALIAYSGISE